MQEEHLIVVRPAAEITVKSPQTRRKFERRLFANLAAAFDRAGIGHALTRRQGRVLLAAPDLETACAILGRTFGIGSFAPVELIAHGLFDDLLEQAAGHFGPRLAGRTFAVRVKRFGQKILNSQEMEREIGTVLRPFAAGVDLRQPDVTVHADVYDRLAHFHGNWRPGPGGLPLGSQDRALVLLSGGFDSAVAAWQVMRRGTPVDHLFCNLGGETHERLTRGIAEILHDRWGAGVSARFVAVDFRPLSAALSAAVPGNLRQIVLKRLMVRAACATAARTHADAIVTGEALGQVSSQTLSNLRSIETAADRPVLRPLIGLDKTEIIAEARRIGTAALSEGIREFCAISAGRPAINSHPRQIDAAEALIDPRLLEQALAEARTTDLGPSAPDDREPSDLLVDHLPKDARPIDLRPPSAFGEWHLDGARRLDPEELFECLEVLERDRPYLLYCQHGTRSALLAEVMRREGFEAYAFAGGSAALRRAADQDPPVLTR